MGQRIVVKRYAEAFADYAAETIGMKKTIEEARALKAVMRDNTEFYQMLSSPSLTLTEKSRFIDNVFEGRFSRELNQLVKLIVEKQRTQMLFDILDYIIINYAHGEETPAVLKSAYPLDLEDVQRVKENLEKKFKRKVRLYLDLDGELLGGLQITMGNTVIDGSLKRRLEDLREKIKAARL